MKNCGPELIDKLLKKYEEEQNTTLQEDPTVFEILGRAHDENLISRMLAYTLKKDGGLVCKALSLCTGENISPCKITYIECEKFMAGGRADIFAEIEDETGRKFVLTIENKIYSWEHGDQTETYFKYVSAHSKYKKYEKAFIYLKPDFNGSFPVCDKFKTLTYTGLLSMISQTDDAIIADFIRHIKKNLTSDEVKLMDTEFFVLQNYGTLKAIMNNAERKFEETKRKIVTDLCIGNKIAGLDFDPYKSYDKNAWNSFPDDKLVIEVANYGSCYRIYRNGKWWSGNEDENNKKLEDREKYYFFVELKFSNNDPNNILVQKLIKRYGQRAQESVVWKFLDGNKNVHYDGNAWGVLDYGRPIDLRGYDLMSDEWKKALKEKAIELINEAIAETDELFEQFEKWKNNNR